MKITVEIDAKTLEEIQRATGVHELAAAAGRAAEEYVKANKRDTLLRRALEGKTDYAMTNEELEAALATHDPD